MVAGVAATYAVVTVDVDVFLEVLVSLYECLGVFHEKNLNMTRLESRPIMGEPWRYMFYADLQLPEEGRSVLEDAIAALKSKAEDVRLLGVYKERSV